MPATAASHACLTARTPEAGPPGWLTTPPPQLVDARQSEDTDARQHGSSNTANSGQVASGQALAFEQQIVQAKGLVAQDPKRVAQVVKTGIGVFAPAGGRPGVADQV